MQHGIASRGTRVLVASCVIELTLNSWCYKQTSPSARDAMLLTFIPILGTMEARVQESNLYAYEMTPNPCARGGGVVVDNGPSSGGEVSIYQIYIAWQPCCLCIQQLVDYWQQRHHRQNYEPCFAPKSDPGFSRLRPLEIGLLVSSLHVGNAHCYITNDHICPRLF